MGNFNHYIILQNLYKLSIILWLNYFTFPELGQTPIHAYGLISFLSRRYYIYSDVAFWKIMNKNLIWRQLNFCNQISSIFLIYFWVDFWCFTISQMRWSKSTILIFCNQWNEMKCTKYKIGEPVYHVKQTSTLIQLRRIDENWFRYNRKWFRSKKHSKSMLLRIFEFDLIWGQNFIQCLRIMVHFCYVYELVYWK